MGMKSSVEPDGQLVSLELTDLKLDDAGQVKVVAVNSEGDASTAARLTVIGEFHHWSFSFLDDLDSIKDMNRLFFIDKLLKEFYRNVHECLQRSCGVQRSWMLSLTKKSWRVVT